ncbi:MAG: methyltransferase domain-containing protein [Patescibacteria group bacterium]|nr:methyltransferase domain-containing protein [Patescibacteria group bacterium]
MNRIEVYNKKIYNRIWKSGDIQKPESWSLWEITKNFQGKKSLEVGPGNYPKIAIKNSYFVEISEEAVEPLNKLGGKAAVGDVTNLSFENQFFDLVVAAEVLEHIKNDKRAFSEIARVLKPSGFFLFSVPLRQELYDEFDVITGHERRYEIKDLKDILLDNGFKILKYRPRSYLLTTLDVLAKALLIKKILLRNKEHEVFFNSPKPFVNLYSRTYAFLEKAGTPKWRLDVENLLKRRYRGITILCQKR